MHLWSFCKQCTNECFITFNDCYTQGDSDVISSYHIYASCFPDILRGKLYEMFVILTSLSY